jgi:hypothetical protein
MGEANNGQVGEGGREIVNGVGYTSITHKVKERRRQVVKWACGI